MFTCILQRDLTSLRTISEKILKSWNRGDLNKKFVALAKDLLFTREKNFQLEKENLLLKNEILRLKGEKEKPSFKEKKDKGNKAPEKKTFKKKVKKTDLKIDREITLSPDEEELPKYAH